MSLKTKISSKLVSLVFAVLVVCFAIAFYIVAWVEPTEDPPGGNAPLPLNTGDDFQSKKGNLALNTEGTFLTGLSLQGYLQIHSVSGHPNPAGDECSNDAEAGRMILDYTNNLLYICTGLSGWKTVDLGL